MLIILFAMITATLVTVTIHQLLDGSVKFLPKKGDLMGANPREE